MGSVDYEYLARTIASLSGIPTRVFRGETLLCFHSVVRLFKDPMDIYRNEIFTIRDHVGYYATPYFHVYGVVNSGPIRIVIGPAAQIVTVDQSIRELAFQANVASEDTQAFVESIKNIFRMPLENLLMMLCAINYMLNGEKLELKDISIHSEEQELIKQRVEKRRTEKTYDIEPKYTLHNTLHVEKTLMDMVRRGDTAGLREWTSSAMPVRAGMLAMDQLRQLKNTFIVTAAVTSRAAIQGGLNEEDSFSMSDAFIQRAELLQTQNAIIELQYNMILEFAEQVEKLRRGKDPGRLELDVANYVRHHLSEPIRTEEVAKAFYLTRTYFAAKFKKETGQTLTDFILREKTEEAKRLLRYSGKSAAAIGAYLGFSSHSHFINVFKKYAGITPGEYQNKL